MAVLFQRTPAPELARDLQRHAASTGASKDGMRQSKPEEPQRLATNRHSLCVDPRLHCLYKFEQQTTNHLFPLSPVPFRLREH